MSVDRKKVGTEDTFRLDIVVGNAPDGAAVGFPSTQDFEVLSRGESTQMGFSVGPGGQGVIKQVRKYTLTMRALRPGQLTIPAASLQIGSKVLKTEPITIDAVAGRTGPDPRAQQRQPQNNNPFPPGFGLPPGFNLPPGMDDPFANPDPTPAGDSDVFLKNTIDKTEIFTGEQLVYSIYIYSRVDLSSVDGVSMPKLEGFWSQDLKSPSQLVPEQATVQGIPYRRYLLRSKAIFPLKPGEYSLDPAEADITTGFLFQGQRVHRKGGPIKLKVKPLPAGGNTSNVGVWRLAAEVNQSQLTLGEPVQLKLTISGKGNLQSVTLDPLKAPPSFRVFDPQTNDVPNTKTNGQVGGTRTIEYVLVPQQTGTFTLPGITLPFFNSDTHQFDQATTEPITITIAPGVNGAQALTVPGNTTATANDGPKNQLVATGLKTLRFTPHFSAATVPFWKRGFFLPLAIIPAALSLLAALWLLLRRALGSESAESLKKKQSRAARKRLAGAEKLLTQKSPVAFYEEIARAMNSFLEAKLNNVTGLTRDQLKVRMVEHAIPETNQVQILSVYETCDMGRYAPGMGEISARRKTLDDAAAAMEALS